MKNYFHARQEIVAQIIKFMGNRNAIIGESGGVDSALITFLCVEALGADRIFAVTMPYGDQSTSDADLVASTLGIKEYGCVDIKPIVDAFGFTKPMTVGNTKARVRMAILYALASEHNGIVIGTSNKTEMMLGYFCYDTKTRALTKNGLKYYNELKEGDSVFSLNLKTKLIEEKMIKKINVFNFKGELFKGKNNGIDFMVTKNHKMVLQDVHDSSKIFLSPLDKYLDNHMCLNIPIPIGWNHKNNDIKLHGFEINDLMYLYGLFIGDGNNTFGKIKYLLKSEEKNTRNKKTGRFSKVKNPLNKPVFYNAYTTCFSIPESNKNKAYLKLTGILDKYQIKWHKATCGIKIVSSDNLFYNLFEECGKFAENKQIPETLLNYSSENLKFLFQGLIDSDGDKRENYYTISYKLATQIVELCFKIGRSASIGNIKPKKSNYMGKIIVSGPSYIVKTCPKIKSRTICRDKIIKQKYSGLVWCPEVPENENLIVERNGSFYLSGNTKFGDGGCDVEPIGDLYKTDVRAMASTYLNFPLNIITKKPSAELWDGQTDESEIGMSYQEMDNILKGMEEHGCPQCYLTFGMNSLNANVVKIVKMYQATEHKRKMPPTFHVSK